MIDLAQVGQRAEAESEKGDQLIVKSWYILLHAYIWLWGVDKICGTHTFLFSFFHLFVQGAAGWFVQGPRQPSQDAEKPKDGGAGCDAYHLAEDHLQLAGLLSK